MVNRLANNAQHTCILHQGPSRPSKHNPQRAPIGVPRRLAESGLQPELAEKLNQPCNADSGGEALLPIRGLPARALNYWRENLTLNNYADC